jgi:hypothetical protein
MYSDSDPDDRDSNLDARLGGPAPSKNRYGMGDPKIELNSAYDRTVSFSDDDDEGDDDVGRPSPAARPTRPSPAASVTRPPNPVGKQSPPAAYARQRSPQPDDLDIGAGSGIASLFSLISKFHPEPVELSVHWKPFIPDLIPAI